MYLADLNNSRVEEKADFEMSLAASEKKLLDDQRCILKSEHNQATLVDLATKVEKVEANLKSSKDHNYLLGDIVSKKRRQLVAKEPSPSGYRERVLVLENGCDTSSAEAERFTTHNVVDKDLLHGVRTSLAPHKKPSQQPVAVDANYREMLLVDKVAIDTKFCKFQKGMQARID